jgi:hypothetical protein
VEIVGTLNQVLLLASLGVRVVALVDALMRPTASFPAAGKLTKVGWCAILGIAVLVGLRSSGSVIDLFNIAGLIAGIVYLVDVRPAVRELGRPGGQNQGPYGTW